MITSPVKIVKQ